MSTRGQYCLMIEQYLLRMVRSSRYESSVVNRLVRQLRMLTVWDLGFTALVTAILVHQLDWSGLFGGCVTLLFQIIEKRQIPDDVLCGKCSHRKDDHHGNCQECLREDLRQVDSDAVPCSRFAR